MDFVASFRFAAWREIRARWPLLLALPVSFGIGALLPTPRDAAWVLFTGVVVAPAVLVLLAAGGAGAADPFWRGLRPAPGASVLVRVLLHLLPVLLLTPFLFSTTEVFSGDDLGAWFRITAVVGLLPLYSTALAARSIVSGFAVLAGPLVGIVVLALGTWINVETRFVPLQWSLLARAVTLAGLALFLAVRWEARDGVWGTSLRRRGLLALVPAIVFLAVGGLLEVGLRVPVPGHRAFLAASEDGRTAVVATGWFLHHFEPEESMGRAWQWEDGHLRSLPGVGVEGASAGPQGSVALALRRELTFANPSELRLDVVLVVDGRAAARCEDVKGAFVQGASWSEDGREVTFGTHDGDDWALSVGGGCGRVPWVPEVQEVRSGGHVYRVSSEHPAIVTLDGVSLPALTYRAMAHGHEVGELPGSVRLVGGEDGLLGVVQQPRGEGRGWGGRLVRFVDGGVEILDVLEGSREVRYRLEDGRVCRTLDRATRRCWDLQGVARDEPRQVLPHDGQFCVVVRDGACVVSSVSFTLSTGERLPLEGSWSDFVLMDRDHLRFFLSDRVVDYSPEGVVTRPF